MTMDIDQVLLIIGGFNKYQLILLLIMWYFIIIPDGIVNYITVYSAAEPRWRCVNGSTVCNFTEYQKPGTEKYHFRCDIDREEWEFDKTYTSIVTEWDLVCERSVYGSIGKSMVFAGWFLGLLAFGHWSDKYGRKPILYISTAVSLVFGTVSGVVPTFWPYAVCRFMCGFGIGGSLMAFFVLIVEFSDVKHRGTSGNVSFIAFSFVNLFLVLFAYLMRNWRTMTVVSTLVGVPTLFTWWWVDESPRWLLLEGREDEARVVLSKVARINKREMPQDKLSLPTAKPEGSSNGNVMDLFRTWRMARTTLVQFYCWFCVSFLYYGVLFAFVSLAGDVYLNFLILSLMNFPQKAFNIWFLDRFGRKQSIAWGLLLAVVMAGAFLAIPIELNNTGATVGRVIFYILLGEGTWLAWIGVYVYSSEAFPTMTRNIGLGWCSGMARVGAFMSPYANWLEQYNVYLPLAIMGSLALIGAVLAAFEKDTKDTPTPETVLDTDPNRKHVQPENQEVPHHGDCFAETTYV